MSFEFRRTAAGLVIDGTPDVTGPTPTDSSQDSLISSLYIGMTQINLAAQAAQSTANTADTNAQTAITEAATAEADAQEALDSAATAHTAAGTAQGTASNAASAAAAAQSTADLAATAAATAQTTAATAASATGVLAASLAPIFLDEIWRAHFRELAPLNPVFSCQVFDFQGAGGDGRWQFRGSAIGWQDRPLSIRCLGIGDIKKGYTTSIRDSRQESWYLAGAGYWMGDNVDPAGDNRAFRLANSAGTLWLSMGTHTAETTHFSFNIHGGDPGGTADLLVPSTVVYAPGFHSIEMRWNVTTNILEGSVDSEPWVLISSSAGSMPGGPLAQNHGCFEGTGEIWLTVSAVGTTL